jgi:hypothetical protein
MVGAYIHIIGLIYIFYSIIKQIIIERGIANLESSLESSVLFYFFLMTLALRLQFLFVKVKIQNRYDQLKEADSLRDKIFRHMELMISKPLKFMHGIVAELDGIKDQQLKKNKIQEIESIQGELQPLMDDIIEVIKTGGYEGSSFQSCCSICRFYKRSNTK